MPAPISHHHFWSHKRIHFSLLHVCVHACVCVVWILLCVCARTMFPKRQMGRHTSMKSTKPLIPPVIYGSQIHVRLKLNKRSFVTDSRLWSGWIALAVSLLQQICPALSSLLLLLLMISAPAHICGLTVLKVLRQHLNTHVPDNSKPDAPPRFSLNLWPRLTLDHGLFTHTLTVSLQLLPECRFWGGPANTTYWLIPCDQLRRTIKAISRARGCFL